MYVGKCTKSIFTVLLICGLLVVYVPCRAYAVGPVVLGPAIKYAIGAGIVAGGLYAQSKDDLNYVVNDYWNKASDHVKQQWQSAVIYGTGIGIILINDPLKNSIKSYLDSTYSTGENAVTLPPTELYGATIDVYYDLEVFSIMGQGMSLGPDVVEYMDEYDRWSWCKDIMIGNTLLHTMYHTAGGYTSGEYLKETYLNWAKVKITGTGAGDYLKIWYSRYLSPNNPDAKYELQFRLGNIASLLGVTVSELFYESGETVTINYVGDAVGFGNATEDRDVKVPCPPVPASEWLERWLDELEEELNRTGNPTLDDETSIEEWEDDWDWYLDEDGNIYKVRKGEPPKNPNDEPIRIPGPPLPAPDVPDDYPTEDDPDITIEHHPPETTITEHPDGSRTEITTQTTTTTKTWWDPTAERWRITIEETTTITTVEYAPDGTEIERTTETITQPKGEREETPQRDDTEINWEPLRRGLYELTEKFPFCLPWDLMRGIQSLEANQWDRIIEINIGDGIWPEMTIDLSIFDEIASITRVILLVVFDLGLIFATRRLMGGDV